MLQKPSFSHPMKPEVYAPEPVPRIEEWRELWAVWDTVTLGMVPRERLLTKPIELRNPCVFYLGHIPTFLDSILSRATNGQPTEPLDYISIFQRGIDPDVDNPDNCHSHSEIPTAWPELEDILVYQGKVRERVNHLYKNGSAMHHKGGVQRALWIGFEHEAMHLETLLYMLLQSDITLPPPGTITPNFATGRLCERMKDPRSDDDAWIKVPGMMFDVGMNDTEGALDTIPRYFGWDKEKPVQKDIRVEPFYTRCYPITNEEYAKYLVDKRSNKVPASWTIANVAKVEASDSRDPMDTVSRLIDTVQVKTVFGPVPLKQAMDWPVMASYDELTACAKWMGGRVPTADELLAIYRYAESTDASAVEKKISRKIDAVNG